MPALTPIILKMYPDGLGGYRGYVPVTSTPALASQVVGVNQGTISVSAGLSKAITGQSVTTVTNSLQVQVSRQQSITGQSVSISQGSITQTVVDSTQLLPLVVTSSSTVPTVTTTRFPNVNLTGQSVTGSTGVIAGPLPLYSLTTTAGGKIGGALPTYVGSFITSDGGTYGDGQGSYTGFVRLAMSETAGRMWMTGYFEDVVAEITIPAVVAGSNINTLNVASPTTPNGQPFKRLAPPATLSGIRVMGITPVNGKLIVGATTWYGNSNEPRNFMTFSTPTAVATSAQLGYFNVTGARHNGGWLIPIPSAYQSAFGKTHISTYGGGLSIESQLCSGIAFWAVNAADITNAATNDQTINAIQLADYNIGGPGTSMGGDNYTSHMWNWLSIVGTSFWVPGTETIMSVGRNWDYRVARANNAIYYKDQTTPTGVGTNDLGTVQAGYFAYLNDAYANYYWLTDINDLLAVKNGIKAANTVVPYEHGFLALNPFDDPANDSDSITCGGTFDYATKSLYLSSQRGARNRFSSTPTVAKLTLAGI